MRPIPWILVVAIATSFPTSALADAGSEPLRSDPAEEPPTDASSSSGESGDRPDTNEEDDEPRRWERPVRPTRPNVLVAYPLALIGRGLSGGYERMLPLEIPFAVTALVRAFVAFPAGGDYRSVDLGGSLEGRFYAVPRGPFTRWDGPAPVGLYVGARVGVVRTSLSNRDDDRLVGRAYRVAVEGSLGYRFSIVGRLTLTSSLGATFYTDFVDGIASTLRPTATTGLEIGWMF